MPTVRAATCFECFRAVGAPPCGRRESSERSARKTTKPGPCSAAVNPCPAGLEAAEKHHGDRQDRRRCKKADGGSRKGRLGREPHGRGFHVDARVIVEVPRSTPSLGPGSEVIMKQKTAAALELRPKSFLPGKLGEAPLRPRPDMLDHLGGRQCPEAGATDMVEVAGEPGEKARGEEIAGARRVNEALDRK